MAETGSLLSTCCIHVCVVVFYILEFQCPIVDCGNTTLPVPCDPPPCDTATCPEYPYTRCW